MSRLLLDTSVIIDVLKDRRERFGIMQALMAQQHELACCAVNVAEVYAGMRAPEAQKTEALLRSLLYIPIRWEASRLAGHLKQEGARIGKTYSLADMIIAAVCLTEELTLVTDNRKDFAMPGLNLHPLP